MATLNAWVAQIRNSLYALSTVGTGFIKGLLKSLESRLSEIDLTPEDEESSKDTYKAILDAVRRCDFVGRWRGNALTLRLLPRSIRIRKSYVDSVRLPKDQTLTVSIRATLSDRGD